MREIKYRAWDNVESKMYHCGEEIDMIFEIRGNGIECTDVRNVSPSGYGVDSMEHLIYMQYTGLKDKNSTEIYEWDIVDTLDGLGVVIFEEMIGSFAIEYLICKIALPNYLAQQNAELEVVGNIYENPELLKEE